MIVLEGYIALVLVKGGLASSWGLDGRMYRFAGEVDSSGTVETDGREPSENESLSSSRRCESGCE
jgi:hypothetical protein